MKKILLSVLITLLVTSAVFATVSFSDIRITDWFYNAAIYMGEHNVIRGIGGRFEPTRNVTRDQAAVMLHRYAGNVHVMPGGRTYKDNWFNFELTFPDTWHGYFYENVFVWPIEGTEPKPIANITFSMLNATRDPQPMFVVTVYSRSVYDMMVRAGTEFINQTLIGQNSSYAVLSSSSQFTPPELEDAHSAITTINSSFRWITGS